MNNNLKPQKPFMLFSAARLESFIRQCTFVNI